VTSTDHRRGVTDDGKSVYATAGFPDNAVVGFSRVPVP
jgi:hypothetical protein